MLPQTSWPSWTRSRWRCPLSWVSSTCYLECLLASLTTCKFCVCGCVGVRVFVFVCACMHMYFWLISLCFRYFKKPLNIFLGFIPEIVFMASLFGYLVLLVFYKWTSYNAYNSKDAPSLLIHFINMCLFNYNDPTNKALYPGQVPSLKSSTFAFLNFIFHHILDCSDLRIFIGFVSMIRLLLCHDSKVSKVSLITHFYYWRSYNVYKGDNVSGKLHMEVM